MKAYGIPRIVDVEFPDVADIQNYGMKSSVGKVKGDQHAYTRNAEKRQATRRIFKHIERAHAKTAIRTAVEEFHYETS